MNKMIKTTITLLLAVVLLLSFVGCDSAARDEAAVRETADRFMTAICSFDLETAGTFTTDPAALTDAAGFKSPQDVKDMVLAELETSIGTSATAKEAVNAFFDEVIAKIISSFSYEIKDVTAQEDGYSVQTTLTHIDFETDFDSLFTLDETLLAEVANEVIQSGKVTAQTSQDELLGLLIEPMLEAIRPMLEDALTNAPLVTEEIVLHTQKQDDAWLINLNDSEMPDFSGLSDLF